MDINPPDESRWPLANDNQGPRTRLYQPRPISSRFIDPAALTKPNAAQPRADFAVALRDHAPSCPPPPEPPTAPGSDHPAETLTRPPQATDAINSFGRL